MMQLKYQLLTSTKTSPGTPDMIRHFASDLERHGDRMAASLFACKQERLISATCCIWSTVHVAQGLPDGTIPH